MPCYEIIFSPTGGTKKVAGLLADALEADAHTIDLLDRQTDYGAYVFSPADLCVIAVPSFGGRVPEPAAQRLAAMDGGGARCVLVAVYGNRAFEDTLIELEDIAFAAGFQCIGAVAAVAEHSILRQFAAGRPDAADEAELLEYAEKIRQAAGKDVPAQPILVPGNHPYRTYDSTGGVMKPKAGKACTACGLCASSCPVGAISTQKPFETDNTKCISCMRCVAVCPAGARRVPKLILAAAGKKMQKACGERKPNILYI